MYDEQEKAGLKQLLVAPLLGFTYALFLPAIGIVMIAYAGCVQAAKIFGKELQRDAIFGWRPAESFLLGKSERKRKKNEKDE